MAPKSALASPRRVAARRSEVLFQHHRWLTGSEEKSSVICLHAHRAYQAISGPRMDGQAATAPMCHRLVGTG